MAAQASQKARSVCLSHQGESARQVASSLALVVLSLYFFLSFFLSMNVALLFGCCYHRDAVAAQKHHPSTPKGKQARADRAGMPGTFRRKPVPPDHKTQPLRSLEPPKTRKSRVCASLRDQNALQQQAKARNCGKYHEKRSRTEVDTSLSASLRSRNECQHQAKARICGTGGGKIRLRDPRLKEEKRIPKASSLRSPSLFQLSYESLLVKHGDTCARERHQLIGYQVDEHIRHCAVERLVRSPERVLTPLRGILGARSVGKPAIKLWRR